MTTIVNGLRTNSTVASLLRNGLGLADQALISGVNFLVTIILARDLGPHDFGTFVVGYTVLLFVNSFQTSLFSLPHNVNGATRSGAEHAQFTTATAIGQLAFAVVAASVICAAGIVGIAIEADWTSLVFVLAHASATWQLQEFARRVLYTDGRYREALFNDLVTYGGQLTLILVLWKASRLTEVSAILAIGLLFSAGAFLGFWQIRSALMLQTSQSSVRKHLGDNWTIGRWLLGVEMTQWLSGQLYPLLIAGFAGPAGAGALRAAQSMAAPTNILTKAMSTMLPSRSSRVYHSSGPSGLHSFLLRVGYPSSGIMMLYCAAIAVLAEPILLLFFGHDYSTFAWLVRVLALTFFLGYLTSLASIGLLGMGKTTPILAAYTISALAVLSFGTLAVRDWGLAGAAVGLVIHGIVVNGVLWYWMIRGLRSNTLSPEAK